MISELLLQQPILTFAQKSFSGYLPVAASIRLSLCTWRMASGKAYTVDCQSTTWGSCPKLQSCLACTSSQNSFWLKAWPMEGVSESLMPEWMTWIQILHQANNNGIASNINDNNDNKKRDISTACWPTDGIKNCEDHSFSMFDLVDLTWSKDCQRKLPSQEKKIYHQ